LRNFSVFWKNDPLRENFQNSVPNVFIATPIDVLCANFMKYGRQKIGEIVCCLSDKKNKNSPRSAALATAQIVPKICQGQPQTMYSEYSGFHPNQFTFDRVIAERVNTVKTRHKMNPISG